MSHQLPMGILHLPSPDDCTLNLCGTACTRIDPQVLEGEEDKADCLQCLIIAEEASGQARRMR